MFSLFLQLDWFANKLKDVLKGNSKVNLIIYIESARSIIDMNQLCQHCFDLQEQGAPFYLDGAIFGSDDFCADIGIINSGLLFAVETKLCPIP